MSAVGAVWSQPFLSTPSAGRATGGRTGPSCAVSNFYPRPPRGGRPAVVILAVCRAKFLSTPSAGRATAEHKLSERDLEISIHALRGEGDPYMPEVFHDVMKFLSTPSAGRATAKTEKNISAFVSL